jgi:hypothetical protein
MAAKKGEQSGAAAPRVFFRPAHGAFVTDKPKRAARAGLRALVPTTIRPEGETNEFLRVYKQKWLSQLDFKSASHVESLLLLSFMVLALERERECEIITDLLIRHVDVRAATAETRSHVAAAIYLSAWLKAKRQVNIAPFLQRARALGKSAVHRDRDWLRGEAGSEIKDAIERKKLAYLVYPLTGIVAWLNDSAGKTMAEELLAEALAATRSLMA